MENGRHGSLVGSQRNSLSHLPVSAEAESRACNSIHLTIPAGQTVEQYRHQWQPCHQGGRSSVRCDYILAKQNGQLITVTASIGCDSNGSLHKHLWLEPLKIDGKKVWIDPAVLNQMHCQAREAHRMYCNPEK
jgi:hypothetical protein